MVADRAAGGGAGQLWLHGDSHSLGRSSETDGMVHSSVNVLSPTELHA